jgi:hypothetical protein
VRTRRRGQRSWRRCRPSTRVAWRSGRLEVTPIVGSISPAPHPTASNAPARVSAGPAMEVRPPLGKGKGKNRSRNAATSKVWAAPRPRETMRRREQPPPGASKRRGPGPGGSRAVTAPTWGSRPPSARRWQRWRGRAALGLRRLRRNSSNRRRSHRRRQRRGAQRRRHHHRSQGHMPRPRRR